MASRLIPSRRTTRFTLIRLSCYLSIVSPTPHPVAVLGEVAGEVALPVAGGLLAGVVVLLAGEAVAVSALARAAAEASVVAAAQAEGVGSVVVEGARKLLRMNICIYVEHLYMRVYVDADAGDLS